MKKILPAIASLFLLVSCGTSSIIGPQDPENESKPHEAKRLVLSARQQTMNEAQNDFSLSVLRRIAEGKTENMFISPLSAEMVLAMLANGAAGDTQTEMLNTLGMEGYTADEMNAYHSALIKTLPYLDTHTTLTIANALWVKTGMKLLPDFVTANSDTYQATIDNLDMTNPSSADVVNKWASDHTNGLIKKVVEPSQFTEMLRMIIANALYFKSTWDDPFMKESTMEGDFAQADGSAGTVNYMHQSGSMPVVMHDSVTGASFLRKYYKENAYCMDVLLPDEGQSIDGLLKALTADELARLGQEAYYREVVLTMPRFKAEYRCGLTEELRALGMEKVFGPAADLSGITTDESLYLSDIYQCTYVNVDEQGTEAAAVTIGMVNATSVGPSETIFFECTHPFIYMIREAKYGTILFAGIMNAAK